MALKLSRNKYMTNCRPFLLAALLFFCSCSPANKEPKAVSLTDSSLSVIFEQLTDKSNPFEFYKDVYENFKFELKSTLIQSQQTEDAPPLESIAIFESNELEESRFYKKSLDPIAEVEWLEKQDKDFIRYDDNKNFLRTSYNPEFEKWKKRMFQDIGSVFDLAALEKTTPKTEKNQWSCYETQQQKICLDSKTGLPVFGKAIKQLKPETAISMVFSLAYGEDAPKTPKSPTSEKREVPKERPKKHSLQKKKKV
jgi:hypothetical protein